MTEREYKAAVERNLRGVHFFSTGTYVGCDECGLGESDLEGMTDREIEHAVAVAGEGNEFSNSTCDSCGTGLAGRREPAHGVIAETMEEAQDEDRVITHFDVCTDCVFYHAYGDLPENLEDEPNEDEEPPFQELPGMRPEVNPEA